MSRYQELYRELLEDPATSFWLAVALRDLDRRDPLDALNDAEALCEAARRRVDELLPPLKQQRG